MLNPVYMSLIIISRIRIIKTNIQGVEPQIIRPARVWTNYPKILDNKNKVYQYPQFEMGQQGLEDLDELILISLHSVLSVLD